MRLGRSGNLQDVIRHIVQRRAILGAKRSLSILSHLEDKNAVKIISCWEVRMDFEAVIFDFDYTLGDSTKGICTSINYALTQLGYEPSELESIRKSIGLSLKETFDNLSRLLK